MPCEMHARVGHSKHVQGQVQVLYKVRCKDDGVTTIMVGRGTNLPYSSSVTRGISKGGAGRGGAGRSGSYSSWRVSRPHTFAWLRFDCSLLLYLPSGTRLEPLQLAAHSSRSSNSGGGRASKATGISRLLASALLHHDICKHSPTVFPFAQSTTVPLVHGTVVFACHLVSTPKVSLLSHRTQSTATQADVRRDSRFVVPHDAMWSHLDKYPRPRRAAV